MPPSHFADAPPPGSGPDCLLFELAVFLLVARSSITGAAKSSYWEKSSAYQTARELPSQCRSTCC